MTGLVGPEHPAYRFRLQALRDAKVILTGSDATEVTMVASLMAVADYLTDATELEDLFEIRSFGGAVVRQLPAGVDE